MPRLARELTIISGTYPKGPMRTLYDLLGARPDDNAEGLRHAFRKAMASRSGLHAGDPDAPERFRQLVEAYDTLRNVERRAAYDRLLELERGRVYSKLRRAVVYVVHNIVSDAISVVGLVVVLAGGHTLFAYVSKPPVNAVEVSTNRSAEIAGIQPAGTGVTEQDRQREKSERATLAETDNAVGAPIGQDQAQSGEVGLSSRKEDRGVPKSSWPDFAKSGDKSDTKLPDTRNFNTHDVKTPEMKIAGKPRVEVKRQARSHAPVKQASLEDTKAFTCSGDPACSTEPPVFGVGF